MKYLALSTLIFIFTYSGYTQLGPDLKIEYSNDYAYTSGVRLNSFSNGKTAIGTYSYSQLMVNAVDTSGRIAWSIMDNQTMKLDTTIVIPSNTYAGYKLFFGQDLMVDDTLYYLLEKLPIVPAGVAVSQPKNFVFGKLDSNLNLSSIVEIFPNDTLGYLYSSNVNSIKYDNTSNLFEMFISLEDSLSGIVSLVLTKFDRRGKLNFFKKWDYDVVSQYDVLAKDFIKLADGRYLIVQDALTDVYFFADTSLPNISSSYFKPDIRQLHQVSDNGTNYQIFGISDGYPISSLNEGKLRYCFMELDKVSQNEVGRYEFKVPDTIGFNISANFFKTPLIKYSGGVNVFASREVYRDNQNNLTSRSKIYSLDDQANLLWKYSMFGDTTSTIFGWSKVFSIPSNQSEFLWMCSFVSDSPNKSYTWIQRIFVDGRNLSVKDYPTELQSEFLIYPNPAQNHCDILLPFLPSTKVEVQITNMRGQVVLQKMHNQRDSLIRLKFDLPKGMYTVSVATKGYETSQQMVVE